MLFSDFTTTLLILVTSVAGPVLAQTPSPITNVAITLCQSWDGSGSDCYNFNTFIYQSSFVDIDNVVASNSATQINIGQISGISALQVNTPDVRCIFGNIIVSTSPSVVCSGYTVTVNQDAGLYNLGQNNGADYALNDNVLCFYCVKGK